MLLVVRCFNLLKRFSRIVTSKQRYETLVKTRSCCIQTRQSKMSNLLRDDAAMFTMNCCHATLNGTEGARLLMQVAEKASASTH